MRKDHELFFAEFIYFRYNILFVTDYKTFNL